MPLILAIEPNRNQTNQIAQMVKHYLRGAELITAASAETALSALGNRIPDLILTPALLGPRDEAALTDHLRQLGSTAAHIHTLSTPIIESSKPRNRDQGGGLLGRRRDKSDASGSVGCDPQVFAEQIKVYLDRAARERESTMDATADSHPAPDTATPSSGADDDFADMDWLTDEPVVADPPPATPPVEAVKSSSAAAFEPPMVVPVQAQRAEPAAAKTEAPVAEKRRPPANSPATRAFEAEFGLPSAISASPPLWRVTEEGIESMSAETSPVTDAPAPMVTSAAPATVAEQPAVRSAPRPSKPAKAKKSQSPPVDDWAYFDPQQSPFRSLLKRLDEIAGYAH